MTEKKRLLALDVLRGITVAGMILVNNAGGKFTYAPLKHEVWNGLTPCDLVFPFFLFIMGMSTYISLNKFDFETSSDTVKKIIKRTLVILCIGLAINWFSYICQGNFFPFEQLRFTGVMTRIALCYGIVSIIALFLNHRYILSLSAILLIIYAVILHFGNGYICDDSNILSIIDRKILGINHLYRKSLVDPEGLFSTIPSIAHTLIGFYCGMIISKTKEIEQKVLKLLLIGFVLIAIGWIISFALPLNKRIWSPSFVCVTCGGGASLLALLIYLIDVKGKEKWSTFFLIFGVNPLFLYVFSEILAILFSNFGIKNAIYENIHLLIGDPFLSSALYALLFTFLLGFSGYMLYRKKIYIKI